MAAIVSCSVALNLHELFIFIVWNNFYINHKMWSGEISTKECMSCVCQQMTGKRKELFL